MHQAKLSISQNLWTQLIKELSKRGRKIRESGAFLLGQKGESIISSFICYDDLDPDCLDEGYINFNGDGYISLWDICLQDNLQVLADIHTHPRSWTGQSIYDTNNPMISEPGHLALIVPNFAINTNQTLEGVGIYEYQGDHKWISWKSDSGIFNIV